ncbi:hypothetical protein JXK06_02905, partial [Patescibacteria group bacterium]|nr:hypothetical protein [Patescibacteria group bacterium]
MLKTNFFSYFSIIILEFLAKILYFPLWWYGVGLIKKIKSLFYFLKSKERELGLGVWAKNILVPMYGQRDFAGRAISFFIRLVQVIFRTIILLIWFICALLMLIIW